MGVLSSLAAKITNLRIPAALKNINIANLMPAYLRGQTVNIALEGGPALDSGHRPPAAQTGKPLSDLPPAYSPPSAKYEKLMSSSTMRDISGYSGPAGRSGDWAITQESDNLRTTSNTGSRAFDAPPAYSENLSEKLAKLSGEVELPRELTKSGLKTIEKGEKNEQIKAGFTPTIEGKGKGSAPGK